MDPIDLLRDLVRIPSHESVEEIREYLLDNVDGATHHNSGCVEASKGEGEPHVLLNTHMDVVPPHVEFERDGDVVRGRGACDAKGSLAAMIAAYSRVEPSGGRVSLVVSPDEETTSEGLHRYVEGGVEASLAVVGEPTGLDVCTAARGRFEVEVEFQGEAAHAASGAGRSAIRCAAEAVQRLEGMESMQDDLLGESRLTVTRIHGGEADNQVPAHASLFVDRRSVPPETQDEFLEKVNRELRDLDCEVEARFSSRPTPFLEAFRTPEDEEVVRGMQDAVNAVAGESRVRAFDAATEASYLAADMPVVVFGPGKISEDGEPVAHSEREYVSIDEVREAADVLERFLESV